MHGTLHAAEVALEALKLMGLLMVRSVAFVGLGLAVARWARAKLIRGASGPTWRELRLAVGTNAVDALFVATAGALGAWRFSTTTPLTFLTTFALVAVAYEVFFYVAHRALHHPALFFLHADHHRTVDTNALTSMAFSIPERVILQAGATLITGVLSRLFPTSEAAVLTYFSLNFALNVWGHVGVEVLPARWASSPLGKLFITTTFHAQHHHDGRGHFGLFTQVLDRLCLTVHPTYDARWSRDVSAAGEAQRLGLGAERERRGAEAGRWTARRGTGTAARRPSAAVSAARAVTSLGVENCTPVA